jgi:hypothetical protein
MASFEEARRTRQVTINDVFTNLRGFKEIEDGLWQLQFSFYTLGSIDLRKNKIIRN